MKIKDQSLSQKTYRLEVVNENSLQRRALKFTRLQFFVAVAGAIIAVILIGAVLSSLPGVRRYIPWSTENDMRSMYMDMALRLDSISYVSRINDAYVNNIVGILNDEIEISCIDSALLKSESIPVDSLMLASDAERQFVKDFEENNLFKLSVLTPIAADIMAFFPPVKGGFGYEDRKVMYITSKSVVPVSSVYSGTVIKSDYGSDGYTVMIQHPNNFLTVYTGLTDSFVNKGHRLNTGSRIGLFNNNKGTLMFEIWHDGNAVSPSSVISFD